MNAEPTIPDASWLEPEEATPPSAAALQRARVGSLSRLLRAIGAAALLAAASTFLLQHWEAGGDLERYATLLAHTALLAVAGFVCGLRADDAKSARSFLALAAGLVPVHFCILGGLVYSVFSWDGPAVPVATYATWVAPGRAAAAATAAATLAVLAPVAWVAFLALARSRAAGLALAYVAANLAFLVPTRDPSAAAGLAAVTLGGLVWLDVRTLRRDASLRTLEGGFARAMLFAPPLLLLARSALHYELSLFFHSVVGAALGLALVALGHVERLPKALREALRFASLLPFGAASALGTAALVDAADLPGMVAMPIAVAGFASVAGVLSLVADERWAAFHRRAALGVALLGLGANLAIFPGAFSAIACLLASIATLAYGFLAERRAYFLAGLAGAGVSLAAHVQSALELYAWSRWGSLALLGAATIVAASLLERHWEVLAARAAELRRRAAAWE